MGEARGKITDVPTTHMMYGASQETILEEAERIVGGERLKHYGPPHVNFRRIARVWTAYIDHPGVELTSNDVAALMILLKQVRMRDGYHRDSVVDTGGYARCQELLDMPAELA